MTSSVSSASRRDVRPMAECAILSALSFVLGLVKIFPLPMGGSFTLLCMLPLVILSARRGCRWGAAGGLTVALLNILYDGAAVFSWGLSAPAVIGCLLLDYIAAYCAVGLAGMFRKKGTAGLLGGIAAAIFLRFTAHVLSGTLIFDAWMPEEWSDPLLYSVVYNGSFLLPELLCTLFAAALLLKTGVFSVSAHGGDNR